MKVLPLALNVLAALLATVATILYITSRGAKLRAHAALSTAKAELADLEQQRISQKNQLSVQTVQLADFQTRLSATEESLKAAQAKVEALGTELSQTRSLLSLRDENEVLLNREIAALKRELGSSNTRLTEIPRLQTRIDELEQALALLKHRVGPAGLLAAEQAGPPKSVLAVGPSDSFIIVNYGVQQGAKAQQKVMIRRGTDFIATALISEVRDEISIAQVDPHGLHAALRKGDSIVLAQ